MLYAFFQRTLGILHRDLHIAKAESLCLGAKVVRGAYLDEVSDH